MDRVGPMPISEGFRYCLTLTDRFSRWPEAIPMKDMEANTVTRAFYDNWVARFGAPQVLTTDQGSQFESRLHQALLKLIGCQRIRTTPFHPQSNGMIERWHRSFKAAIMCHATPHWTRVLSTVLLGLRIHLRLDTNASPAEFLYGTTLRVPGEFVLPDDFTPDPQMFVDEFREHMREVKAVPVEHRYKKKAFFFKDLHTCSHVFKRVGGVKKSLERPYTGPHKVLNRILDRVFEIDANGTPLEISVEDLKPAFFIPEDVSTPSAPCMPTVSSDNPIVTFDHASIPLPSQTPVLRTYVRKRKGREPPPL